MKAGQVYILKEHVMNTGIQIYGAETTLTFGKHCGLSILRIAKKQPSYLDWCLLNVDGFCVSDEALEKIREQIPSFGFSEEAEKKRKTRLFIEKNKDTKLIKELYEFEEKYLPRPQTREEWEEEVRYNNRFPDKEEWLRDEFGDDADTAYWNID